MRIYGVVATLAVLWAVPHASSAEKFADKTSRCASITVTAIIAGSNETATPTRVETLENTQPSPVLQLYIDRETGSVRAAKIVRKGKGGVVDVTSIPLPVIVDYTECRPGSEGRGIPVEYYDDSDFLP